MGMIVNNTVLITYTYFQCLVITNSCNGMYNFESTMVYKKLYYKTQSSMEVETHLCITPQSLQVITLHIVP